MFGRKSKPKPNPKLASELFASRVATGTENSTENSTEDGSARTENAHRPLPVHNTRVNTKIVVDIADIPSYRDVLTTEDGIINLPETAYGSVALTQSNDPSVAVMLFVDDVKTRTVTRAVKIRASQNGIRIAEQIVTTPDVIKQVYATVNAIPKEPVMDAIANNDMVKLMDDILYSAVKNAASDIHIEVAENNTTVRQRIHGDLQVQRVLSHDDGMTLCRATWAYCDSQSRQGETSFNEKKFVDLSMERTIGHQLVRIRYSQRPALGGLDITMRIILPGQTPKSLFALGYDASARAALERMLNKPNGLILFSGVTGSGKSTSLQSCLTDVYERYRGKKKVITIENPIEYPIPGARQTAVTDDDGFRAALKSAMRSDPDILQLSEIRDEITSQTAQRMVQTGHLVFSTVHATSPMATISRLIDLEMDRNVLAEEGYIVGIITQKLLKTLCHSCRMPYKDAAQEGLVDLGLQQRIVAIANEVLESVYIRGNDSECAVCNGTGTSGRTLCCEILVPNRYILEFIHEGNLVAASAYWHTQMRMDPLAGRTLLDHAIMKMKDGDICPIDIESELDYLDSQESLAEIEEWYKGFDDGRKSAGQK